MCKMCDYFETADEAKSSNGSKNHGQVNITEKGSQEGELLNAGEYSERTDNIEISADFTYKPDKYEGEESGHYWPDAGRPEKNEEQDGDGEEGLQSLGGVGVEVVEALSEAGIETLQDVDEASIEDLTDVEGVSLPLAARMSAEVMLMELPEKEDNDECGNEVEADTPSFLEEETFKVGY